MALWRPTRRELIATAPLLLGAAALPAPLRASASRSLRLFVLGDWGMDGDLYQKQVAALMDYQAQRFGCDLIVTTGDNFYTFGVSSSHDPQWRTSYEAIYSPELRGIPWFPVAGNHDWGGNIRAQLDRTGTGGWHMPWLWYDIPGARFGRPDVHLFFIDTTVWKGREKPLYQFCGQSIRAEDIARQKTWLEDALSASCASTKLVFGHHPIFSAERDGWTMALQDLDAILTEARVTAYVNGHDHSLYHLKGERLDYICSGGGAEERPRVLAPADPRRPRTHQYFARAGFAMFDIGPDAMTFSFVDRDGRITPPETLQNRGNHAPCSGPLPVHPAVERKRTRVLSKAILPCASVL